MQQTKFEWIKSLALLLRSCITSASSCYFSLRFFSVCALYGQQVKQQHKLRRERRAKYNFNGLQHWSVCKIFAKRKLKFAHNRKHVHTRASKNVQERVFFFKSCWLVFYNFNAHSRWRREIENMVFGSRVIGTLMFNRDAILFCMIFNNYENPSFIVV